MMHSAVNQTKDIVPSIVQGSGGAFTLSRSWVAWLTVALLWISAAYFLVRMPADAETKVGLAVDPSGQ